MKGNEAERKTKKYIHDQLRVYHAAMGCILEPMEKAGLMCGLFMWFQLYLSYISYICLVSYDLFAVHVKSNVLMEKLGMSCFLCASMPAIGQSSATLSD